MGTMGTGNSLLRKKSFPFTMGQVYKVTYNNRTKGQSMVNMVKLNLVVLKDHILKQDPFGYKYLVTVVDLTIEEIIHSRRGNALPIPMELIEIFDMAYETLKVHKKTTQDSKHYIRSYVSLWSRLYRYVANVFDYLTAERIFFEAYNALMGVKYQHTLKVV